MKYAVEMCTSDIIQVLKSCWGGGSSGARRQHLLSHKPIFVILEKKKEGKRISSNRYYLFYS
jgi:hypothetical protein